MPVNLLRGQQLAGWLVAQGQPEQLQPNSDLLLGLMMVCAIREVSL